MSIDIRTSVPATRTRSLELQVLTTPARPILGGKHTFSPTACALIVGPSEMVLVDAPLVAEDVDEMIAHLATLDRRLTSVFVTHGHADHYFGGKAIASQYPGADLVTTPAVAAYLEESDDGDVDAMVGWFDDAAVADWSQPVAMDVTTLTVDGHELHAIDVGQGDIAPSAAVHVPSLDVVIAGDIAYNGIHAMLALSGPEQWADWIASTRTVEALAPRVVVAGHKRPELDDDASRVLAETRDYISQFASAYETAGSARDIIATMRAAYPDHGNITTLITSAAAAMDRKSAALTSSP